MAVDETKKRALLRPLPPHIRTHLYSTANSSSAALAAARLDPWSTNTTAVPSHSGGGGAVAAQGGRERRRGAGCQRGGGRATEAAEWGRISWREASSEGAACFSRRCELTKNSLALFFQRPPHPPVERAPPTLTPSLLFCVLPTTPPESARGGPTRIHRSVGVESWGCAFLGSLAFFFRQPSLPTSVLLPDFPLP